MLGLLFVGNMVLAAAPNPECNAELCWSVSPAFCVAAKPDEQCETQLMVSWTSQHETSLCLVLAAEQKQCWRQQKQGQWQHLLRWSGKTVVSLQRGNQIQLSKELIVLSRQPEKKRRLVAPWSVF